ncbi:MAG TPA: aldo/keto reductase [Rhizobacter sp.]|nr:aldo/keto reductase [Rhizobacter sp.]
MNLVELSPGGPRLSPIVAGAWRLAEWGWSTQQRLSWIEQCLELGASSFDHADIYGGYAVEALFGEALALKPGLRQHLQLVSKVGIKLVSPARPGHTIKHYDTSAAHIAWTVDNALRQLRTDYLDLLLIHRPDALLDADEVARTFEQLVAAGKLRHVGVSNFTPSQFELLNARIPLSTNQVELHPLNRQVLDDGTLDQCQRLRVRPMIWSPLAGGALFTSHEPAALRVRQALAAIAQRHGCSATTVAHAWLLRLPSRPLPIVGSRRPEALREAVAALALRLDAAEWTEIWAAATGHEVP